MASAKNVASQIASLNTQLKQTQAQLQAQSASAKNQMDFQERMSSTAHQREVEDLKAAGLNPVLSSGGSGASTPSGSEGYLGDSLNSVLGLLSQAMDTNAKALVRAVDGVTSVSRSAVRSGSMKNDSSDLSTGSTFVDEFLDNYARKGIVAAARSAAASGIKYAVQNAQFNPKVPVAGTSAYKAMQRAQAQGRTRQSNWLSRIIDRVSDFFS